MDYNATEFFLLFVFCMENIVDIFQSTGGPVLNARIIFKRRVGKHISKQAESKSALWLILQNPNAKI